MIFITYRDLYNEEHERAERLIKEVEQQQKEIDNCMRYIAKQNIVIHLLKDRIKELKGIK